MLAEEIVQYRNQGHGDEPDGAEGELVQIGADEECCGTEEQTGHIGDDKSLRLPPGVLSGLEGPEFVPDKAVEHACGVADQIGCCSIDGGYFHQPERGRHSFGKACREIGLECGKGEEAD